MTFSNPFAENAACHAPRMPIPAGWNVRVMLLVLMPAMLSATTYYASPSGADAHPGTYALPFRTVARGIQAAAAGDTIVLQDGTYPADTALGGGSTSTWLLWISKSGTSGSPITLKAEHKQKAILDCGNALNGAKTGCMGYIFLGNPAPAYWVFQDLVFTRTYDIAFLINAATAAHDITVKGCRFEQIGQHVTAQTTGMDGVYANQSQYNLVFDGNVFDGIGRLPGSTYMANDHALYLHSSNTTVTNNVFYGSISGWGVQTALGFSGLIASNTFAFTRTTNSGHVMLWDVSSGNVTVENNIFYNPPGGVAVNTYGFTAPSCVMSHNLVFGGSLGSVPGCTSTNTVVANPSFVNASSDFHLQLGSPAIGAGVPVSGAATDYDGVARPQGNGFDIGAFEFPSVQPTTVSAVAASNVTANSATISWTTSKSADSQVQYGLNGYTNVTAGNATMVTQHSVLLTNLTASTTYHYSVLSRDSSGYLSPSGDFAFTLAAAPPPPPPAPAAFTFSFSASASSISMTPGQTTTDQVVATRMTGPAESVMMAVSGLPAGVSATYYPLGCTATCASTISLSATTAAPAGTYAITVSGWSSTAIVSAHVTLTIAAPVQAAAAASSWAFNEGAGTTTADASGNGNTGTLMGHPAWTAGTFGSALSFSGAGDYVNVNEGPSLELSTAMTVSFWIKASDVPGVDQRIVSKNYDWDVKLNGSGHIPQFSSGSMFAALNYSLPMGSWEHVTFTFMSGAVAGYINGAQTGLSSNKFTSGYSLPSSRYGLYIGTDAGKGAFAKGLIDDVRIYNRALTAAEVSALYLQTKH
jgi:Concanavalin A-like lectin/glucanases superfamily/Purple acid Phosphatase, N-terminal domain/Protein of unknown function (DUF1565)